MDILRLWEDYAVDGKDIDESLIRPLVMESWKRCRQWGIDPYYSGTVSIGSEDLIRRKQNKTELLAAAMPHLHKLYKIIKNTGSVIAITDEDGIILDSFADTETLQMRNFPSPGTIHHESTIGTSGIGTALSAGIPLQLVAHEHWLRDNHDWYCNSTPILRQRLITGCLNLSCPVDKGHEHSLGLVVATANAIEREMELNLILKEKKKLSSTQEAIIELLDTGIIVIGNDGRISQYNNKTLQILNTRGDWVGRSLDELFDCSYDFERLLHSRIELDNFEIAVKIGRKHSYIGFSTAFIENTGEVEAMVIRIREPESIRKFANIAGGSTAIYSFDDIIGTSDKLLETLKIAQLATKNNTNVLITGESGTGKELIAQAIHNGSSRKNKPFVAINCGALSRELIQSELFGYVGGAFTGANKNGNPGKFELADSGTLFLDEIGEMPLDAQTNLLRILQTGRVLRIGAMHPNTVDVRIITATNKNLEWEIGRKNFRHDLYYRLNVLQIKLPPLRERKNDIETLAEYFLARFVREMVSEVNGFDSLTLDMLKDYSWPGNIRELENAIERAVAISEGSRILPSDLPDSIKDFDASDNFACMETPDSSTREVGRNLNEVEMAYIKTLLREHRGNLRAASAAMGVARSTLYNKIKKYEIGIDDFR
ncbi:MAG: sigma 54-interacting transcriptional regulator [Spirochaetales bacterium]|nr:sigma 54-interacting transcriptional regulator [Spirochaetales bacterium]